MEIYYEGLALTRSAVENSPDNTRRPLWLNRPMHPVKDCYRIKNE